MLFVEEGSPEKKAKGYVEVKKVSSEQKKLNVGCETSKVQKFFGNIGKTLENLSKIGNRMLVHHLKQNFSHPLTHNSPYLGFPIP